MVRESVAIGLSVPVRNLPDEIGSSSGYLRSSRSPHMGAGLPELPGKEVL